MTILDHVKSSLGVPTASLSPPNGRPDEFSESCSVPCWALKNVQITHRACKNERISSSGDPMNLPRAHITLISAHITLTRPVKTVPGDRNHPLKTSKDLSHDLQRPCQALQETMLDHVEAWKACKSQHRGCKNERLSSFGTS